jgi:hypothetical protein
MLWLGWAGLTFCLWPLSLGRKPSDCAMPAKNDVLHASRGTSHLRRFFFVFFLLSLLGYIVCLDKDSPRKRPYVNRNVLPISACRRVRDFVELPRRTSGKLGRNSSKLRPFSHGPQVLVIKFTSKLLALYFTFFQPFANQAKIEENAGVTQNSSFLDGR